MFERCLAVRPTSPLPLLTWYVHGGPTCFPHCDAGREQAQTKRLAKRLQTLSGCDPNLERRAGDVDGPMNGMLGLDRWCQLENEKEMQGGPSHPTARPSFSLVIPPSQG